MNICSDLARAFPNGWEYVDVLLKTKPVTPVVATKHGRLLIWEFTGNRYPLWICIQPPTGVSLPCIPMHWKYQLSHSGWYYATVTSDSAQALSEIRLAVSILQAGSCPTAVNPAAPHDFLELVPHCFDIDGLIWAHAHLAQAEALFTEALATWEHDFGARITELSAMPWRELVSLAKANDVKVGGSRPRRATAIELAQKEKKQPEKESYVLAWLQKHAAEAIPQLFEDAPGR